MYCQNCGNTILGDGISSRQHDDMEGETSVIVTGNCDWCGSVTVSEYAGDGGSDELVLMEQEDLDTLLDYETLRRQTTDLYTESTLT